MTLTILHFCLMLNFLEEEQLSTPFHKDVNDLKLDPSNQSTPTITQPEDMTITSVVEDQTDTLISSPSNVKCSNTSTYPQTPDNSKLPSISQTQSEK